MLPATQIFAVEELLRMVGIAGANVLGFRRRKRAGSGSQQNSERYNAAIDHASTDY